MAWGSVNSAFHWLCSEETETEKQGFHQNNLGESYEWQVEQ